jgi:hypothetical protein
MNLAASSMRQRRRAWRIDASAHRPSERVGQVELAINGRSLSIELELGRGRGRQMDTLEPFRQIHPTQFPQTLRPLSLDRDLSPLPCLLFCLLPVAILHHVVPRCEASAFHLPIRGW